jgi:hypothetical protein
LTESGRADDKVAPRGRFWHVYVSDSSRKIAMPRVFISYRRSDSEAEAGRLFDFLERALGARNVFKDVDSIAPGVDFRRAVAAYIEKSDVFLLIMGRFWADARNEKGERRLEQPGDFVRMEIQAALSKGVRIIPVLIQGARMPVEADVPEEIAPVLYINALHLRSDPDFRRDCGRLLAEIKAGRVRRRAAGVAVGAGVILAVSAAIYTHQDPPAPVTTGSPEKPAVQAEDTIRPSSSLVIQSPVTVPKADSSPPRPIANTRAMVPEVVAIGKRLFMNLDQTRNTGPGFNYWPNGGLRITYHHLATFASYETLNRFSPHPIFIDGPHGTRALDLDSRFTFGHYNPAFLLWFDAHLEEMLSDGEFVQSTTPLFRRYLARIAVTYWATYRVMYQHPMETRWLVRDYLRHMDNRTLPESYFNTNGGGADERFMFLNELRTSYDAGFVNQAVYFWLRRHIDGTNAEVFSMLESLLGAYDMLPSRS